MAARTSDPVADGVHPFRLKSTEHGGWDLAIWTPSLHGIMECMSDGTSKVREPMLRVPVSRRDIGEVLADIDRSEGREKLIRRYRDSLGVREKTELERVQRRARAAIELLAEYRGCSLGEALQLVMARQDDDEAQAA